MGQNVGNWTPNVTATTHHGQSGAGVGGAFSWRLHFGAKSIDENVAMGANAWWTMVDAYRANDTTGFNAAFDGWLQANGSAAAYAERAAFRAAFWDYLP